MKSLFQALVLVVVIVGGFIVFVGLFSGECSSGSSSPSTVSSSPEIVQSPSSVNRFTNSVGSVIKVGSNCYTNGAGRQSTLMNLTLYKQSTLTQNASEMRTVGDIPHGTKVKIVQIEELNGRATAQIKWKNKLGWMSINLLSTRYQKPVGDRF